MTPDPRVPGSMRFGVSPAELSRTTSAWLHQSEVVAGIDLSTLSATAGTSSRSLAAVRATARPARVATTSISVRLASMGMTLRTFRIDSDAGDRACARAFAALADR